MSETANEAAAGESSPSTVDGSDAAATASGPDPRRLPPVQGVIGPGKQDA